MARLLKTTVKEVSIRLEHRVRFPGDPEPPFWQVDVWPDGKDFHAVGDTPYEALMRLASFWKDRTETAQKHPTRTESDENETRA